jgi:hypothetical protein
VQSDLEPRSPAEAAFLADVSGPGFTLIGDGGPPDNGATEPTVRADLIRAVLMREAGAPRLHEKGLRLGGALITGVLDLEGCRIGADIRLADCRFEAALVMRSCLLDSLLLDGSILSGLLAEKLEARGGVYLRGTTIEGLATLRGAQLGGGLVADGATLTRPDGDALMADGLEARGGFLLRGAQVRGTVSLVGARLGGDVDATGADIAITSGDAIRADGVETRGDLLLRRVCVTGRASLTGAAIGGDVDLSGGRFDAPGADAVILNRAVIGGALFLRDGARVNGLLNLNGTSVDALVDAPESWPKAGDIALNRFLYQGFLTATSDAALRLDWLARQSPARWGESFWPQPYEQLAAVLRASGQGADARRVLMVKERLQRRARRAQTRPWLARVGLWWIDGLLRVAVGYGLRPLRAALWLFLLWMTGVAVFAAAEQSAAVRPSPAFVVRAPEWVLCGAESGAMVDLASTGERRAGLAGPGESQLDCWRRRPEAQAYTKFNPWMFAFDKLLPGSATGQTDVWELDTRTPLGAVAKRTGHALSILGGALGLLAIAGFSGIVRSD